MVVIGVLGVDVNPPAQHSVCRRIFSNTAVRNRRRQIQLRYGLCNIQITYDAQVENLDIKGFSAAVRNKYSALY